MGWYECLKRRASRSCSMESTGPQEERWETKHNIFYQTPFNFFHFLQVLMTIGQLCFYDQIKAMLLGTPYFSDNLVTHFSSSLCAVSWYKVKLVSGQQIFIDRAPLPPPWPSLLMSSRPEPWTPSQESSMVLLTSSDSQPEGVLCLSTRWMI